jgi:hypothetical protein
MCPRTESRSALVRARDRIDEMSSTSICHRLILTLMVSVLPVLPLHAATRNAPMRVRAEVIADCSFGGLDLHRWTVLTTCRGDAPFRVVGPQDDIGTAVKLITIIF